MLHRAVLAAMALVYCVVASPDLAFADRSPRAFISKVEPGQKAVRPGGSSARTVEIAKRYLGTNPTKMARLWCHNFSNMILQKAGFKGSGSNFARSGLKTGKPVPLSQARPGDLVVLARGKGGHSGFYLGRAPDGDVRLISGNTRGRVVGISDYPPGRVLGVRRFS